MRKTIVPCSLVFSIFTSITAGLNAAEPAKPIEPLPSPAELAWQQDELTLFRHFGINTFTGRATGLRNEDPNRFQPKAPTPKK